MKLRTTVTVEGFIEGGHSDKYRDLQTAHAVAQALTDTLSAEDWQRVIERTDEIMRDRFRVRD